MFELLIDKAILHAQKVFWLLAILTATSISFFSQLQIDTDPENMLAEGNSARKNHNQTKHDFNLHDALVVGVVNKHHPQGIYNAATLNAIEQITQTALTINGVVKQDVMSMSLADNIKQIQLTGEKTPTLKFEWLMPQAPSNDQIALEVKSAIQRLPLLENTLAADNNLAAAIYIPIQNKNQSYAIAEQLRSTINTLDKIHGDQWHITGLPVAEDQFGVEMFVQMAISAPLAGLTILVLLWMFFRHIPFIAAPMIVAMVTVIVTMGLLIALGFTVHIMSSMIAIFLMPIAVVDSVHVMSEFADRYQAGNNPQASAKQTIKQVVLHLFKPMLFTSLTSAVGFLSLLITPIPPVQIFGAFIGFGILLAFIVTLIFLPAYISCLSEKQLLNLQIKLQQQSKKQGLLARIIQWLSRSHSKYNKTKLLGFGVIFIFSIVGMLLIQVNDNPVRWFKSNHEIRVADAELNQHFAGTYNAYIRLSANPNNSQLNQGVLPPKFELVPSSLQTWFQQIITLNEQNDKALTKEQLIFAIDDKLFSGVDKEATTWLEQWLTQLEHETSKPFTQPDVLSYIEGLQNYLNDKQQIGKSSSIVDIVKVVNRELHSGLDVDYQLPTSSQGIAQSLLQYQSSHRPQDLWHFVTPDYQNSLIWLQLTSGDNQAMLQVIEWVETYVQQQPLPKELSLSWAGKAYLNVVWQEQMVWGMAESLISAFIIVFIMMTLLFRSITFGLLAMLPLSLTISFIYGLIGWLGKDYDMPIAVLSALTLGLSVDFAIHFLQRAREIYQQQQNIENTIQLMFAEPANAISRNAIIIALGFTPLLFAPLVPYITVGIFLASIMAISALVTLVLLPTLFMLFPNLLIQTTKVQGDTEQ
ncbi:RND transporter [Saccharobesus litoralis]|uniref:RND transporter n=1 Tax=Saccharobesus litoralis TaxID=2172099 RepID=A0A2S0VV12_9ALTE|nr:MMPL family transporter [Saccharobesus litoralis]AWB67940.1 RND transporter [Saccharobesus litoralis]